MLQHAALFGLPLVGSAARLGTTSFGRRAIRLGYRVAACPNPAAIRPAYEDVLGAEVVGSIEYGVEVLDCPLVVVLGHDSCGAVVSTAGPQA